MSATDIPHAGPWRRGCNQAPSVLQGRQMEGARREKSETALQAKICKYLVTKAQMLLKTKTVFAEKPERGDQF